MLQTPTSGSIFITRLIVTTTFTTPEVASLDNTLSKATALGTIIALPKMPVPNMGWLAYIKDPDGNVLGLLQPEEKAT